MARWRGRAAAGAVGGSWHALLTGLAQLVAEVAPDIALEVVPGGGVENHAAVGAGEHPAAILNPPMCVAARAGRSPFSTAYPDLRVAVANLTVNHLQLMVARTHPLEALGDWPARRLALRVAVEAPRRGSANDRVGTVDRLAFDQALAHLGVREGDVARWGGALVPAADYRAQLALYTQGEVDALWQFMAIPSPSIVAAHAARPLRPVQLPPALLAELAAAGFDRAELPAGAYGAVDAPVPTVSMATSLGFHAGVPEEVVHAVTAAICEHPERVRAIHPAAAAFDPARAGEPAGAPLHPGAERWYREHGVG